MKASRFPSENMSEPQGQPITTTNPGQFKFPVTSYQFRIPISRGPLQNVCKFIKLKKFYELNWYNFHIIFEKEAKWNAARRRRRSIQPVEPSGGLSATHTSVFKMGECECVSVWGNANVCVWRGRRAGRRVWK